MAPTLPQSTADRLNAALDTWPDWQAEVRSRPKMIRPLAGFTNDNFLVADGKGRWSLRLNTERRLPGINRSREREVLSAVAHAGVTDAPVYWSDDCLVSRYYEGDEPDLLDEGTLAAIGRLFRQIHGIDAPVDDVLDPLDYAQDLVARSTYGSDTLLLCFEAIRDRYLPAEQSCLCHNDLSRENLIQTRDKGLVAIDWEYARLGDPAFDVAVLAEMGGLGDGQVKALLAGYGDEGDLQTRLPGARLLYALIDVLWWRAAGEGDAEIEARVTGLRDRLS